MHDSANELFEAARSWEFVSEDGEAGTLELEPPATAEEVSELSDRLPRPLPNDVRSLLVLTSGFSILGDEVDFLGRRTGQYLENASACSLDVRDDGCGNSWFVDVLADGTWGGVYFACHDPPVLLYQSPSLISFVRDILRSHTEEFRDDSHSVWGDPLNMWPTNPLSKPAREWRSSADPVLRRFSTDSLDHSLIVDLRDAEIGEGMNWGCFGPETQIRRCGAELVFSLTPPHGAPSKPAGFLSRFFRR